MFVCKDRIIVSSINTKYSNRLQGQNYSIINYYKILQSLYTELNVHIPELNMPYEKDNLAAYIKK
jgi:hypothetical protein